MRFKCVIPVKAPIGHYDVELGEVVTITSAGTGGVVQGRSEEGNLVIFEAALLLVAFEKVGG